MPIVLVQTDIYSLLGVVLGAFVIGVVGTWLFVRRRRMGGPYVEKPESDA